MVPSHVPLHIAHKWNWKQLAVSFQEVHRATREGGRHLQQFIDTRSQLIELSCWRPWRVFTHSKLQASIYHILPPEGCWKVRLGECTHSRMNRAIVWRPKPVLVHSWVNQASKRPAIIFIHSWVNWASKRPVMTVIYCKAGAHSQLSELGQRKASGDCHSLQGGYLFTAEWTGPEKGQWWSSFTARRVLVHSWVKWANKRPAIILIHSWVNWASEQPAITIIHSRVNWASDDIHSWVNWASDDTHTWVNWASKRPAMTLIHTWVTGPVMIFTAEWTGPVNSQQ